MIQRPDFIERPFAAEGDKAVIPDQPTQPGRASMAEGFPAETQKPLSEGGIPPAKDDFNGIFNLFSQFLFWYQSGGMFPWSEHRDYAPPAIVAGSDGEFYKCLEPSGPGTLDDDDPPAPVGAQDPAGDDGTYWEKAFGTVIDSGGGGDPGGSIPLASVLLDGLMSKEDFIKLFNSTTTATADTIPIRTADGTLRTQPPLANNDAVNLKFFNDNKVGGAPMPQAAAGVGRWGIVWTQNAQSALPAGGTYAYIWMMTNGPVGETFIGGSGSAAFSGAGVAAGGTTFGRVASAATSTWLFYWRIT